ncbi:MAG: phospho-N-acetylmuramoyl-pentapeptide-transferase [Clostridia bacterium]
MNAQMLNLIISFLATLILGVIIMPILKKFNVGQVVREDGPKEHLKKNGTPTMGGVIMLIVIAVMLGISSIKYHILILPLVAIIGFGIVGFIDDYKKLILKNSKGLSPLKKILGLCITIVIFILLYINVFDLGTDIIVPFIDIPLHLSLGTFIVFTTFILLATSNAVNLTDGLDGLATGVVAIIMTFFTIIAFNNGDMDMCILGLTTIGTCLAFLLFNTYPAKVFMGDTGSLALGGAVAAIAIIMKMPLYLAIVAIICILETLSVILQVLYFKITKGKRLFKMAPLHHHFELMGLKENLIVNVFWFVTIIACFVGYYV